ncbi:Txe/YoeB family addiction module toxin [Acutalibacter sp. 1XD8-36]|uniref:Txe/YoeB family addiction module toxin n=1 Tax=Acutalibacter sp. 1XD8-36 TaxID=2320852 RepID=UPI00141242C7|nr:Txe/YoeB family addiction module toxin [Acutalibacter sp. 1XD8-36]NBJ90873.1 Txe/YoeB family addiction module toxin [Acutalibacter sp. 1XD8-36]
MGRDIKWDSDAWEDYCGWQQTDKAITKRINALIKDAQRNPYNGIGKPEPLKYDLAGLWSRRINDTDRLTYKLVGDTLVIMACKGHYDQ